MSRNDREYSISGISYYYLIRVNGMRWWLGDRLIISGLNNWPTIDTSFELILGLILTHNYC